jgi:bacterioferritin
MREPIKKELVRSMNNEKVIAELNRFLRGRYMGIHQYAELVKHARDPRLKDLLRRFRDHAEKGAEMVAERIRQLGGEAVDGVGVMGEVQLWMQKLKGYPEQTEHILRDALKGENRYGIRLSHEMVAGDLDEESKQLIDTILEEDQKRADELHRWLAGSEQPSK